MSTYNPSAAFPQQAGEPTAWGRFPRVWDVCTGCGEEREIVGWWGAKQEKRLCTRCDDNAWLALLRVLGL